MEALVGFSQRPWTAKIIGDTLCHDPSRMVARHEISSAKFIRFPRSPSPPALSAPLDVECPAASIDFSSF